MGILQKYKIMSLWIAMAYPNKDDIIYTEKMGDTPKHLRKVYWDLFKY